MTNRTNHMMTVRLLVKDSDAIYPTLVLIGMRQNEERLHTVMADKSCSRGSEACT